MRITLVSARFPPQRCGVGDYTSFLGDALARMGNEVQVLTAVGELDQVLYPLHPNVSIHRVVEHWGLGAVSRVLRAVREFEPDALLIQHTPHSFDRRGITLAINLLPVVLRAMGHFRVVTNFHELYIPLEPSLKRGLGSLWQRAVVLLMSYGSHGVSVTATEWQRRLGRLGLRKPVHVIPVGSNIPAAQITGEERMRIREQILGTSTGFLISGFGALHDRDVNLALDGLRQLKRERAAKLVWIGSGSLHEPYRASIETRMRTIGLRQNDILWTGTIPHPEVSKLLSASDLLILPFTDGISTRRTSAVTGFQHGIPLLTTRGWQLDSCFVHGENVYVVPVGQQEEFANALLNLAHSPQLRARLRTGARVLYESHFAWDVIARKVAQLALGEATCERS